MGWELVGGDPAPGSVHAVESAAEAFLQVAELALDARNDLRSGTAGLGMAQWKGTAAETFRTGVGELPTRLDEVERSYRSAHRALRDFGDTLEREQHEARVALIAAEQAAAERDAARRRLDAAQLERDSLRTQKVGAEARHLALQGQRALTIEPAQRVTLERSVASARSRVERLRADSRAADATVARCEADVRAAEHRLEQAVARSGRVRERLGHAVDGAVRALKAAEEAGNLPSRAERLWTDARETTAEYAHAAREAIVTYGPKIVKVLDLAQSVFSLLAILPTPFAPFFATASLVCGASALLLSLAASALQPGGMKGADWAEMAVRVLSVGASGALVKATRAAAAGSHAAATTSFGASRGLQEASSVTEIGKEYLEDGTEGAVVALGAYVFGKGVSRAATAGLEGAVRSANKSTYLQGTLRDMSRSVRTHTANPSDYTLIVPTRPQAQVLQSFLGHGSVPPGGDLPGRHLVTDVFGRALSREGLDAAITHGTEAAYQVVEKVPDGPIDELKRNAHEEIDIDLSPSPYGGQK